MRAAPNQEIPLIYVELKKRQKGGRNPQKAPLVLSCYSFGGGEMVMSENVQIKNNANRFFLQKAIYHSLKE